MRPLQIALLLCLLIFTLGGCKKEEDNEEGYNCDNETCSAAFENPQYLTLEDCQSICANSGTTGGYNCLGVTCIYENTNSTQYSTLAECENACANNSPGTVEVETHWTTAYVNCDPAYTVEIGLGYSSNDVANEAYFASATFVSSPAVYTKGNLSPGTYYYKAKKTYNASTCGTGQGIPPVVQKSGSFMIEAGEVTQVDVGTLNF